MLVCSSDRVPAQSDFAFLKYMSRMTAHTGIFFVIIYIGLIVKCFTSAAALTCTHAQMTGCKRVNWSLIAEVLHTHILNGLLS